MLVLFDIDATLIKTSRAGLHAMRDGFAVLFDRPCDLDGIEYAGCLDPMIFRNVLVKNDVEPTAENLESFRDRYRAGLAERLEVPGTGYVLDGAAELVTALDDVARVTLGLLTGNYEDTGRLKLERCGIDDSPFEINAFGNESPHDPPERRHLPPVAMDRYRRRTRRDLDPRDVVIIGDTPNDVDCARSNGCRSLGVATGLHDVPTLHAAGADLAVESLVDTDALVGWILANAKR